MSRHGTSWWADAVRGAIAGGAAVWVMDLVTTGLAATETKTAQTREAAAMPNGQSSVANLVDRVAARLGVDLDAAQAAKAAQAIHYGLGVMPGALYGIASRRLPGVGLGRGLGYGAALWAANDEYLNTALGLAGPPEAYPTESHVRGFVGHLVLGALTETGIAVLGG